MSNMNYPGDAERYPDIPPLGRFNSNFKHVSDYAGHVISVERYLQEELSLSDDDMYGLLRHDDIASTMSSSELYYADPESAKERFRLMVYNVAIPIYEMSQSKEQVDSWMPAAMRVVSPPASRHVTDSCYSRSQQSLCCGYGLCPKQVVTEDMIVRTCYPDFDSTTYLLYPEKTKANTIRRIRSSVAADIMPKEYGQNLESLYLRKYRENFPQST